MYKLAVLCAFVAAAVAEPSGAVTFGQPLAYAAPLTYSSALPYSSTVISPAVTTISKQASSVVHPSPSFYYAPSTYTHFIKKRSAPLYYPTTYAAGSPFLPTTYNAPVVASAPLLSGAHILPAPIAAPIGYATAHLIKKRSPQLIPTTYNAYSPLAYSTPFITSSHLVSAGPYYSSPVISQAPVAYTRLIK